MTWGAESWESDDWGDDEPDPLEHTDRMDQWEVANGHLPTDPEPVSYNPEPGDL